MMAATKTPTPSSEAKEFSQNTSLHGLRVMGDPNASVARRIIWTILVVSNAASVLYHGVFMVLRLFNPGTQTSIQVVNHMAPISYPAVTICNNNNYRLSYLQANPELTNHLLSKWGLTAPENRTYVTNSSNKFIEAAHQVDDMVVFCYAERNVYFDCWKQFKQTVTDIGVCYTFNWNASEPLSAHLPGIDYGLFFSLRTEKNDYFYSELMFGTEGLKVLIHDPKVEPQVNMFGFSVSPGEQTQVALHKNRVIYDKGMDCYDTKDTKFVNPLRYYASYSRQSCLAECRTKYIEKQCDCRPLFSSGAKEECETHEGYFCTENTMLNYTKAPGSKCVCPEECDRVFYDAKLSTARFPSKYYVRVYSYLLNITEAEVRDDMVLLAIYFQDATETVTQQRFEYGFSKFWSDLGGLMGIALGASILTLYEVIEFVWFFIVAFFNKPSLPTTGEQPQQ